MSMKGFRQRSGVDPFHLTNRLHALFSCGNIGWLALWA
jgi:hypothetical protein